MKLLGKEVKFFVMSKESGWLNVEIIKLARSRYESYY
jgi:hypothetical protein